MSTTILLFVALAWAGIALAVAYTMRRQGHDFSVWLLLAIAFGPLSIPLAFERIREHKAARTGATAARPPPGGFDLLAGLDGSEESFAALAAAVSLFGDDLTTITLATVLDYDTETSPAGVETRARAQEMLDRAAERLHLASIRCVLLFGPPDRALSEFARANGMELIVVGAKGRGGSEALFGSVTSRLIGAAEIPVLVGPRERKRVGALQAG